MPNELLKNRLDQSFFDRDTLQVAKDLLGVLICRQVGKEFMAGRIVETEAYTADDPACHAYSNAQKQKKGLAPTGRSLVLFGEPGCAYVYLNYGMYWLFNVVTESHGTAGAVLIRAVEPVIGLKSMEKRRPSIKKTIDLANGPGKLSLALDIGPEFNAHKLFAAKDLYLAKDDFKLKAKDIVASTRIGITKAADLDWRFYVRDNSFVSKG